MIKALHLTDDESTKTEACKDCGEPITGEYSEDAQYSEVTNGMHCWDCYESEIVYAGTIVELLPSESEPLSNRISENFGFDNYGDPIDRNRFNVDAEGFPTVANTVEVTNGSDLWGLQCDIRDVAERLREDHAQGLLPFPAYVTVKQTGNFAVYMTVNVAESDRDTFTKWLNGSLFTEEESD